MAQLGELTFEALRSNHVKDQSQIKLNLANLKNENAENQLEYITLLKESYNASLVQISNSTRNILRLSYSSADMAFRELFFSMRALEIYALKDVSEELTFHYGHIHPDHEEDVYSKFEYDDDSATENRIMSLVVLLEEYIQSWGELTDKVTRYNEMYSDYLNKGLQHDIHFITFGEASTIEEFRKTHKLRFTVQNPIGRAEPKIKSIIVGFIDAKSNETAISCIIEHTGNFTSKTLDGKDLTIFCRPATAIIQAVKTNEQYEDLVHSEMSIKESFWGRGLETTWNLSIEESIISSQNVDLSNLSSIKIAMQYDCFYLPSFSAEGQFNDISPKKA